MIRLMLIPQTIKLNEQTTNVAADQGMFKVLYLVGKQKRSMHAAPAITGAIYTRVSGQTYTRQAKCKDVKRNTSCGTYTMGPYHKRKRKLYPK